jgi:hypothetical protein
MEVKLDGYTVQELIDYLQQIEDKSRIIYFNDSADGVQPVRYIGTNTNMWGCRLPIDSAIVLQDSSC